MDYIHVQQHADEVNDTRFHDVLPNVLLYPLESTNSIEIIIIFLFIVVVVVVIVIMCMFIICS